MLKKYMNFGMSHYIDYSTCCMTDIRFLTRWRTLYRVCFYLFDGQAPARHCSEFLRKFLKVIIDAVVCIAPVIDCSTSLTGGVWHNAGRSLRLRLTSPHPKLYQLFHNCFLKPLDVLNSKSHHWDLLLQFLKHLENKISNTWATCSENRCYNDNS